MEVCFEISDRFYEEIGPWPLRPGDQARAQLYAFRDHSRAPQGGRLLLPDLALAPAGAPIGVRCSCPPAAAVCGVIGTIGAHRLEGGERREEVAIRLECSVPICLVLRVRRWDNVDVAPAVPIPGMEAWRMARPPRVADLISGVLELQELAFESGGVSSFPFLDASAPDYPISGTVARLERLDLDPTSPHFGTLVTVERLPEGLFWPHRYCVTLAV